MKKEKLSKFIGKPKLNLQNLRELFDFRIVQFTNSGVPNKPSSEVHQELHSTVSDKLDL